MEMLDYGDGIIVPKECMARTIFPPLTNYRRNTLCTNVWGVFCSTKSMRIKCV